MAYGVQLVLESLLPLGTFDFDQGLSWLLFLSGVLSLIIMNIFLVSKAIDLKQAVLHCLQTCPCAHLLYFCLSLKLLWIRILRYLLQRLV